MRRPVITLLLIIANLVVLGLMFSQSGETFSGNNPVVREGMKINDLIRNGELYRLFSSMFIHLSILHILMNMFVLWELGSLGESVWSRPAFLIIYAGSGLAGSLASFALSANPSAGASGAVFGLAGALLAAKYFAKDEQIPFSRQALGSIGIFVLYNIVFGLSQPGIDNAAHIGGLIVGGLLGLALIRRQSFSGRLVFIALAAGAMYLLYNAGMQGSFM